MLGEPEAEALARREARKAVEEGRIPENETGEDTMRDDVSSSTEEGAGKIPLTLQVHNDALVPEVLERPQVPSLVSPAQLPKRLDDSPQAPAPETKHTPNIAKDSGHDVPQEVWDAALGESDEDEISLTEGDNVRL
jgi:hypothetical protein